MKLKLLLLLVVLWAAVSQAQTNFPGGYDNTTNLPVVGPGDTITSGAHNTQNSALFAMQHALGLTSTVVSECTGTGAPYACCTGAGTGSGCLAGGPPNDLVTMLNNKAGAGDMVVLNNNKVLNYTLNAGAYPGADIGAQVNAALADCNTQVGSGSWCRVTIPPKTAVQSTAITIGRANTELDCQNAQLQTASTFTDAPIKINFIAPGAYALAIYNITVRNCYIDNRSQSSISWAPSAGGQTDPRVARVVAWRVNNLRLEHLTIIGPLGGGVDVQQSQGIVDDIQVGDPTNSGWGPRPAFTGSSQADGVYLVGQGYTGGAGNPGQPIYASNLRVYYASIYGVHAVAGAQLQNVDVNTAGSSCIVIGGTTSLAPVSGWVTLDGFTTNQCSNSLGTPTGAVGDPASNPTTENMGHVTVTNGFIRLSGSDGIRFTTAKMHDAMVIAGNRLECFGSRSALSNSRGVYVQNASNSVIQDNNIGSLTGCPAITGTAAGIELSEGKTTQVVDNIIPGVNPSGNAYGIVLSTNGGLVSTQGVFGNVIRNVPNAAIVFSASAGGLVTDVTVRDNTLNGCQASSTCGQITFTSGAATSFINLFLIDNWAESTGAGTGKYGILTTLTGSNSSSDVVFSNFWQGTEILQTGTLLAYIDGTEQHTPSWVVMTNTTGSTIVGGCVVCANGAAGVGTCSTSGTARLALGVAVASITAGNIGDIQTTGSISGVPCDGTVTPGDLLIRSSTTAGSVMADNTPNPGETLGKALTACSTTLTALLGTGQ